MCSLLTYPSVGISWLFHSLPLWIEELWTWLCENHPGRSPLTASEHCSWVFKVSPGSLYEDFLFCSIAHILVGFLILFLVFSFWVLGIFWTWIPDECIAGKCGPAPCFTVGFAVQKPLSFGGYHVSVVLFPRSWGLVSSFLPALVSWSVHSASPPGFILSRSCWSVSWSFCSWVLYNWFYLHVNIQVSQHHSMRCSLLFDNFAISCIIVVTWTYIWVLNSILSISVFVPVLYYVYYCSIIWNQVW